MKARMAAKATVTVRLSDSGWPRRISPPMPRIVPYMYPTIFFLVFHRGTLVVYTRVHI
jgi:hypothetical protein